ncbi:MAG: GSCFA domain-containing protein [Crocinitomicaceae bacterium]|nr:GSCFA domain-containing protein [Crocinitomicaceae bacterium]
MDHFFLQYDIPKADLTIQHGDGVCLIGSCFSDEIAKKLQLAGHTLLSNPYGTIFHPSVLAYQVLDCFNDNVEQSIFERAGSFYSWNTSTLISGTTKEELQATLQATKKEFKNFLKEAKLLIVTFGTAWGYELIEEEKIVANCHKMPAQLFTKFLSSPYELVQDWVLALEKLHAFNPELKVIFTVSPVRHTKDGLPENNLSKARLIEAVHQLSFEENCRYFPSYELIIDVLRDYRFYKSDKIHPTQEAIDFVWKQFENTHFSDSTIELNKKVEKINLMKLHKTNNQDANNQLIKEKESELSALNNKIFWMK